MLCVLSLFIYSLYDIQKVSSLASKIIILVSYINFASVPNLYLQLMYKL